MDSRRREQTAVEERGGAKTIEFLQEFTFFDKPIPSSDDEIIETADIAYKDRVIGGLVGRIFTSSGERIAATGAHIAFTIDKKDGEVNTNAGVTRQYDPFGVRFETPVFYMTFSSGQKYASLGTLQESGKVSFTDWIKIDKNETEDKNRIRKLLQNRKAQPQPFRLHELLEAKYKIT